MPTAAASTSSHMPSLPSLLPFSEKYFISLSVSAPRDCSERVVRVDTVLQVRRFQSHVRCHPFILITDAQDYICIM